MPYSQKVGLALRLPAADWSIGCLLLLSLLLKALIQLCTLFHTRALRDGICRAIPALGA